MQFNSIFGRLAAALTLSIASVAAWSVPTTQLGFALDGSGSVGDTNYGLLKDGLSAAMAAIPTDGTIEVTVVGYGTSVVTVVSPTVIDSPATLATVQGLVTAHARPTGSTNTSGAITTLYQAMVGSANFSTGLDSVINLATDGFPNSQSDSEAAAAAAAAAGIDALSIEAIGDGVDSDSARNALAAIAFPDTVTILAENTTTIPNPLDGSWVVPVSDFGAPLAAVMAAKIQAVIDPDPTVPAPAPLLLLSLGMLGLAATRRQRA